MNNARFRLLDHAAEILHSAIEHADAVVFGAGAGLPTAAGLTYSGPHFEQLFPDLIEHHGLINMYSAGFYPWPSPEEK